MRSISLQSIYCISAIRRTGRPLEFFKGRGKQSLAAMGMTIYNEKEAHFEKLSTDVSKELESLTEEQRISLFNILDLVEAHIDEHLDEPNSDQD